MVSQAHRFLHRQDPSSPALARHCVLQGSGVNDLVFHDFFYGCVTVGRSVELWAAHAWSGEPDRPFLIVRLTRDGELDFSGNEDGAAAQELFDSLRNPRAPRYGRRRSATRERESASSSNSVTLTAEDAESARADGLRVADAVSASAGSGQGLVNRMEQIAQAIGSRGRARVLVVVDELAEQLEALAASGQAAMLEQARQVLRRRWLNLSNQVDALVVYLDPDRKLSQIQLLTSGTPGVKLWEIGGPRHPELRETLTRIDARSTLHIEQVDAISRSLASRHKSLRIALGNVARTFERFGNVTLAGVLDLPPIDEARASEVLRELDALTGLEELKARVRDMVAVARERRRRLERDGIESEDSMHLVFTGEPGTGKTTVARIVARLFHAIGALQTDSFREVSAKDIKSEYVGETRTRMQTELASAIGGVLFIDEAQQFGEDDSGKSKEAIDALVPMAWNHRNELIVILAGYAEGMSDVMRMDPGLPRRFPEIGRIEFHSYTPAQLWQVLDSNLVAKNFHVDPAAVQPLRSILNARASRRGFGNAGGVENLVNEIRGIHDARVGADDHAITVHDLPPRIVRREEDLADARRSLERMTGLSSVKDAIDSLRAELEYAEMEQDEMPAAPRLRFVGPPGTGKTTVARLVGQLFYGMGLLPRKHVVEVTGAALKGAYVGHTAPEVRRRFEEARGGVLFIDEAYGMAPSGPDNFADEALQTFMAELTSPENRDTVVVLAGYKPEIDRLMAANNGLARRLPHELVFESFSPAQCVEVARALLAEVRVTADDAFFTTLAQQARAAAQRTDFGNAGWVGNRVSAARSSLAQRVTADRDSFDAAARRHLIAADLGGDQDEPTVAAPESMHDSTFVPGTPLPRPDTGDDLNGFRAHDLVDSVCHLVITTEGGQSFGTAFVATHDNVFVTNHHVVDGAGSIEVLLGPARGSAVGRVIATDPTVDLALIAVDVPPAAAPLRPLPLARSTPDALPVLRELVVVGNAQVRPGEEARIVIAKVGRNQVLDDTHFETDGAIEEGFSGGPLWDQQQRGVAGIVVGGKGRGVKMAIRAENAMLLLERLGYTTEEA